MSEFDTRRFVICDWNWQPKGYTPDYKTTIARSPSQALVSILQSVSETTGPDFSHLKMGKYDNDLLLNFNHGGLPVGERVIMCGRVVDQYGKPVPHTLVEALAGQPRRRVRHRRRSPSTALPAPRPASMPASGR